jgi:hypothetical protein
MPDGSKCRRKKPGKISFAELMGAAGMSGFGALLEAPSASASCTQPPSNLSLKAAALIEKLNRHSQAIRALDEPLARRVAVLSHVLSVVTRLRITSVPLLREPMRAAPAVPP